MAAAKTLVARLTLHLRDGSKKIVELHTDAAWHQFYRVYAQQGRRRKVLTGYARRQMNINDPRGLDVYEAQQRKGNPNITASAIKVYKKREYQRLLTCPPTDLRGGLAKTTPVQMTHYWELHQESIPVRNWPKYGVRQRELQKIGLGTR